MLEETYWDWWQYTDIWWMSFELLLKPIEIIPITDFRQKSLWKLWDLGLGFGCRFGVERVKSAWQVDLMINNEMSWPADLL